MQAHGSCCLLAVFLAMVCRLVPSCAAAQERGPVNALTNSDDVRGSPVRLVSRTVARQPLLVTVVGPTERSPAIPSPASLSAAAIAVPELPPAPAEGVARDGLTNPPFATRSDDALPPVDLGILDAVLPPRLEEDLARLKLRVQKARDVVFGDRGIFRVGEMQSSSQHRLRFNLQASPEPGVCFTVVTS